MTDTIIPKLCACGCGLTFIPSPKRPHVRFVYGHRDGLRPAIFEAPLCACGCGQPTRRAQRHRQYRKYIAGHHLKALNAPRAPGTHHNWRGGVSMSNGYVYINNHTHHRAVGYRTKRCYLVIEAHLGRLLRGDEEVHHINGVKDDDRAENLAVMTKREHMRLHMNQRHAASPER